MSRAFVIGIKYCGGCNPTYDRGAVAREIAVRFPQAIVRPVGEGPWDLAVVLHGCGRACADLPEGLQVTGEADVPGLIRHIEKALP